MRDKWFLISLLTAFASGISDFFGGFIPEANKTGTPHFPHHKRQMKHHPKMANGKWVMKHHR